MQCLGFSMKGLYAVCLYQSVCFCMQCAGFSVQGFVINVKGSLDRVLYALCTLCRVQVAVCSVQGSGLNCQSALEGGFGRLAARVLGNTAE